MQLRPAASFVTLLASTSALLFSGTRKLRLAS